MSTAQEIENKDIDDQKKKIRNIEHKAYSLCGRTFEESKESKFIKDSIHGTSYALDTINCMSMFKRVKRAYGERLGISLELTIYF
ncbi:MAG TPA: hypothetical protein VKA91_05030 [Nitrososphaeraceae archaeon]|nr:hypothetical protein [Nitrososphaeraceae archaeon]